MSIHSITVREIVLRKEYPMLWCNPHGIGSFRSILYGLAVLRPCGSCTQQGSTAFDL